LAFAAELATLDLTGTWLVTLSACDTGVGALADGEDALALKRAMAQAGARNVVTTLWPVNDRYACQLMRDFYSEALSHHDAPKALAAVQRRELTKPGDQSLWKRVKLAGPFVVSTTGPVRSAQSLIYR